MNAQNDSPYTLLFWQMFSELCNYAAVLEMFIILKKSLIKCNTAI